MSHEHARKSLRDSVRRQKTEYDKKAKVRVFDVGDVVLYYYKPLVHKKLSLRYTGPYVIKRKLSDVTFEIKRLCGADVRVVHPDTLKHCLFALSKEEQSELDAFVDGMRVDFGSNVEPDPPQDRGGNGVVRKSLRKRRPPERLNL